MKFVSLAAVLALGLAPVAAIAQNATTAGTPSPTVEPGGTSQDGLPVFAVGQIPFEAVIAGGFVLVGGAVVGVIAATNDDSTPTAATTTN